MIQGSINTLEFNISSGIKRSTSFEPKSIAILEGTANWRIWPWRIWSARSKKTICGQGQIGRPLECPLRKA